MDLLCGAARSDLTFQPRPSRGTERSRADALPAKARPHDRQSDPLQDLAPSVAGSEAHDGPRTPRHSLPDGEKATHVQQRSTAAKYSSRTNHEGRRATQQGRMRT